MVTERSKIFFSDAYINYYNLEEILQVKPIVSFNYLYFLNYLSTNDLPPLRKGAKLILKCSSSILYIILYT
jgi:hypothetical protein